MNKQPSWEQNSTEEIKLNAEKVCISTSGKWEFYDCNSACGTPATKKERIQREIDIKNGNGLACAEVCVPGNRCVCFEEKYWASLEEGCIKK